MVKSNDITKQLNFYLILPYETLVILQTNVVFPVKKHKRSIMAFLIVILNNIQCIYVRRKDPVYTIIVFGFFKYIVKKIYELNHKTRLLVVILWDIRLKEPLLYGGTHILITSIMNRHVNSMNIHSNL